MDMSAERTIDRPASEVFAYFADAANNPRWQSGMRSCEWITEPPIGLGSRYRQHARFAGRDVVSIFEVTEYQDERRIRIETVQSTFPIQVTRTVEPLDGDRCIVSTSITGGPRMPWPLDSIAERLAQRSVDADYDRLRALLEA